MSYLTLFLKDKPSEYRYPVKEIESWMQELDQAAEKLRFAVGLRNHIQEELKQPFLSWDAKDLTVKIMEQPLAYLEKQIRELQETLALEGNDARYTAISLSQVSEELLVKSMLREKVDDRKVVEQEPKKTIADTPTLPVGLSSEKESNDQTATQPNESSDSSSKRYIKIKELSTMFGWPVKTIYGWVNREEIPYLKPGKELMFDLEDIHQWLETKKVQTVQQFLDKM